MNRDEDLQRRVLAELRGDRDVQANRIGVAVSDGVVTLTGVLARRTGKIAAEKAVGRVAGVRGLAEELVVETEFGKRRDDAGLAYQIVTTLYRHPALSGQSVEVEVENGAVTLSGTVSSRFQRGAAAKTITHIHGIRSIANLISVHNPVSRLDRRSGIEGARCRGDRGRDDG